MIAQFHFFPVDALSLLMGGLAIPLLFLVFMYSLVYIRTYRLHYFIPFFILASGMVGVFFARDFLSFFIFLEAVTLSAYFLIIQPWASTTLSAGLKYLLMNLIGGMLILFAILLIYNQTGTFEFTVGTNRDLSLPAIVFIIGCLIKCGAVPFHTWLPDAHPAAPSPISALLSGMIIKIGIYGILRVFIVLNVFNKGLIWIGAASMLFGVAMALRQANIKRLLAYHSISQMGYILLGLGIGGGLGLTGGIFHAVNHALFKMLLFLCAGSVIFMTGERQIKHLGGLMTRMPVTFAFFTIGALSISGIPPFNGFFSKEIISYAVEAGRDLPLLKLVLVFTAAGTFASFFKMFRHIFLGDLPAGMWKVKDPPLLMVIPMFLLASACLGTGVLWQKVVVEYIYPIVGRVEGLGQDSVLSLQNFFSIDAFMNTFLVVGLGLVIYFAGLKMGWLGVKGGEGHPSVPASLFSLDNIYIKIAESFVKLGNLIREMQYRTLNWHLFLIFLFLAAVYFWVSAM